MRRITDSFFGIPSETPPDDFNYVSYRNAVRFVERGAALFIGGAIAHFTGIDLEVVKVNIVEVASDVAMVAGGMAAYLGLVGAADESLKING